MKTRIREKVKPFQSVGGSLTILLILLIAIVNGFPDWLSNPFWNLDAGLSIIGILTIISANALKSFSNESSPKEETD